MVTKTTWRYYSRHLIPDGGPHEVIDEEYIKSGEAFKDYPNAICATFVSNFDKIDNGEWYYVIKDSAFDLSSLKAKRRYEITKGRNNFIVAIENHPVKLSEELYRAYKESLTGFKGERVTTQSETSFKKWLQVVEDKSIRGGVLFLIVRAKNSFEIAGFAHVPIYDDWASFSWMKTIPRFERDGVNAALVYGLLEYLRPQLERDGFYISDGSRTIFHKTAFQDYLEKYFQFRKAYCKLNIVYNPRYKWIIKLIYPFRNVLKAFSQIKTIRGLVAVLKMEEISRKEI